MRLNETPERINLILFLPRVSPLSFCRGSFNGLILDDRSSDVLKKNRLLIRKLLVIFYDEIF